MQNADILQRSSAHKLNIGLFFSSLKSNEEEAMRRRFVKSIVLTSYVEIVEGSVCADVLTGIGVGGGMKIDSDIPTFVL